MNRFLKRLASVFAVMLLIVCCGSLTACEKITTLEVEIQVCNYTSGKLHTNDDGIPLTIQIQLHDDLAPETVKAITQYAKEGYYDNCVFYLVSERPNQLMVGDIKFDGKNFVQNQIKPTIKGEFEKRSVTGSNLYNKNGMVGLWRTWGAQDELHGKGYDATNGMDTGRATLYLPTANINEYNGYFCVFGEIDLSKYDLTLGAISVALSSNNFEEYIQYYTGEYDATKVNENYGLTFHCEKSTDFYNMTEEQRNEVFKAKGGEIDQLVEYNQKLIRIPKNTENGEVGAMIKSVKVK